MDRYDIGIDSGECKAIVFKSKHGTYVKRSDAEKLQAENKRLRAMIGKAIIYTIGLDRDYVKCQKTLEQALKEQADG